MAEAEVNQFLTHLAVYEKVSASTQNQALSVRTDSARREKIQSIRRWAPAYHFADDLSLHARDASIGSVKRQNAPTGYWNRWSVIV